MTSIQNHPPPAIKFDYIILLEFIFGAAVFAFSWWFGWRRTHLDSCWSPCLWFGNVRDGTLAVGVYTIFISILCIVYTANAMNGGDSSQLVLPFFEASISDWKSQFGLGFTIVILVVLIACSALLIKAVRSEIRGLLIPWGVLMLIVILFQICFGLHMIFTYYIYLEMVFGAACNWLWMGLNLYCWLVVRSYYRNIKRSQSPDIVYDQW